MVAFLFALMLVQLAPQPSPAASEPAPAGSPAAASTASAPPAEGGLPGRLPPRGPADRPVYTPGDVVIRNSGSTNSAGFTIVVHPDASADIYSEGTAAHKTVGTPQAHWLFAKVREAQPLDAMVSAHCMKSASFGTTTTVAYAGQVSPDLSCGGGPEAHELVRTIGVIVNQLGVSTAPGRFRRRLL